MNFKIRIQKPGYELILLLVLILTFSTGVFAQIPNNPNSVKNKEGLKPAFVEDEIIVQFKPGLEKKILAAIKNRKNETGLKEVDALNRKYGVSQITRAFKSVASPKTDKQNAEKFGLNRTFVLKVPKGTDIEAALKEYNSMKEVEYAEVNSFYYPDDVPNDSLYHLQWGLNNTGQAIPKDGVGSVGTPGVDINIELAWTLHKGSSSTTLAILDTGIDYDHPEFAGRMVPGYDFINDDDDPMDDQNHGTACAGIAAAAGNNSIGVAGVNWNCLIMPVKIGASDGFTRGTSFSDGIIWAADNGADVLSISYGGPNFSQLMQDAVNYAHSLGCVLVASRGNNNDDVPNYPASYGNVIAVGALSPCNERTSPTSCDGETGWGSSYGDDLDVMAPGTRIHTTDRLGAVGYDTLDYAPAFNGTSAACPFVAGAAALILSYVPDLSNDDIRDILRSTAVDIGDPEFDNETGYGRMDVYAALNAAKSYKSSFFGGKISLSDNTFSFSVLPDDYETSILTISNIAVSDTADLIWKLSGDFTTEAWLTADVKRGRIPSGNNSQIQFTANTFGMTPGNYQAILEVVSSDTTNRTEQVVVNLEVLYIPPPEASITSTSLNFALNAGMVANEVISVSNIADPGSRNLHWSASILGTDLSWIDSDISGAITAARTDTMIQVTINSGGLAAGSYYASIEVYTNDSANLFYQIPVTLSVAEPLIGGKKLYAFNFNEKKIFRSDLDGSNVSPVLVDRFRPGDGAIDAENQKLYWIDTDNRSIFRSKLNGVNKEQVLPNSNTSINQMYIDAVNSHIYWTQGSYIRRANLDGTDAMYLITNSYRSRSTGLSLDIAGGKVYWLDGIINTGVYRANIDGSEIEFVNGGDSPAGLALDLFNEEVYWGAKNSDGIYYILKQKFNESNAQIVYSGIKIEDLAIDAENGKLYWTSNNEVFRGNTDGTNVETLNIFADKIALDLSPALPEDTAPPIAPKILANIFLQCASEIPPPVALSAIDEVDGYITVSPTSQITVGSCANSFVLVRTWTFTDRAGNTTSVSQTISVDDTTPPSPPEAPTDLFLECASDVPPLIDLTATDNCDGPITVSPTTVTTFGSCSNNFVQVRTWTFMDVCGNESSVSQTISVKDDITPVAQTAPADVFLECTSDVPPLIDLTATDNCDDPITVSPTIVTTFGSCANDFVQVRTWTFVDQCGNSSSVSQIITVKDDQAPVITNCPVSDFQIASTDEGQCYYTASGSEFDVNAIDNCTGDVAFSYSLSGATVKTGLTTLSGVGFNYGQTTVIWTATDECGNSSTCTFVVGVNSIKTLTTVTVDTLEQQYSDLIEFKATVTPWGCSGSSTSGEVVFYVGSQAMGQSVSITSEGTTTASYSLSENPSFPSNGQMAPGNKTVTAAFVNTPPEYIVDSAKTELSIIAEDAIVEYTGMEFQATEGSNSSEATVELRAVIQSVSDGAGLLGDVRNACVTIEVNNSVIASGLKPELINASDLSTGSIVFPWTFDIGNSDYESYDVKIIAECYFTGLDQTVITVYKPVGDFITGGGHIKPTLSVGTYASNPDLKTNFGFHVKFNKTGKNLQGGMNIIFRHLIGDEIHLFQIKSNSMSALGINTADPNASFAEFESKANLRNLTTGESLGGNLTLQSKIIDRGNPGLEDEIAITLWDKNELLYSSEWSGMETYLQYLVKGNLVVQAGFELKSSEIVPEIAEEQKFFEIELYPNPTSGKVYLEIRSSEISDSEIVVRNIIGSEIFRKRVRLDDRIMLDLSQQVSGMYTISINLDEHQYYKKLILNKK